MLKRILFILFLIIIAILLLVNPNFKKIAAGIAILIFGMISLEEGFKVFTKGPLQLIMKKATDKLYKSISAGAIVTTLIQSSSLVSVITISFISAGLINLTGGLGLIFGANIGSTTTAWLIAAFGLKFNIASLAFPMTVFGVVFLLQKNETLKGVGNVLVGLGFFFLGIHYMKEGFDVFKDSINLIDYAVSGFLGVLIFTGLGMIITTILQSSGATLALILTALAAGQISYENALALAIGANIGTTITAVLSSLSSNIAGKRLAGAHFIFNVVTGLLTVILIFPFANFVNYLANLFGISPTNFVLKLALFHTLFNVFGVLLMIPFMKKLEELLTRIIKDTKQKDIDDPKYLNEAVLKFPSSTILALINESKYVYINAVFEIVAHGLNIHRDDIKSQEKIKKIIKRSRQDFNTNIDDLYLKKVKTIYGEIIRYAATAQNDLNLNKDQNNIITKIKIANRKMVEIIKDVKEINKNVSLSFTLDNTYLTREYNSFRKKLTEVLRFIYLYQAEQHHEKYAQKLMHFKKEAMENIEQNNKSIDTLIRKNLITSEMASSLFNDYLNLNDIIKKLIEVAELLYDSNDTLFENGHFINDKKST